MNPETSHSNEVMIAALQFLNAGVNVVPVMHDGSKRPQGSWKQYQTETNTWQNVMQWADTAEGFGIITGTVSGNLEMLELEGRAVQAGVLDDAHELAHAAGIGELWDKLTRTYTEATPSGGIHWLYRIDLPDSTTMPGNTKIAQQPGTGGNPDVFIETRGEGGFVVVAPSHGTIHPTGNAWIRLKDSTPDSIITLTWDERNQIHAMLEAFDRMPHHEEIEQQVQHRDTSNGLSPGDDYNQRATWREILEPQGWKLLYTDRNGQTYWERPGKDLRQVSATTNKTGTDNLYVFSTSTNFEPQKPYSKFAAHTLLTQGSTSQTAFSNAAKDLRLRGYGQVHLVNSELAEFKPQLENIGFGLTVDPVTGEVIEKTPYEQMLETEIISQRIRRQAKRELDLEELAKQYEKPEYVPTLTDELKLPDDDPTWIIDKLWPTGGNILLTAAYKSGKTTLVNNVIKSLSDGNEFLDHYDITPHTGRITYFNYEVDERTMRRWIRDAKIANTDKITMVHLRGMRLPITIPTVEDYVVDLLQASQTQTWIVDPFARAFSGCGDENSNSDVGVFLEALDVIKERAGVENLILVAHTGRNAEEGNQRARGATRIDDWADVRWMLTKNETDERFLSASGRDVEQPEFMLSWDASARRMSRGQSISKTQRTKAKKVDDVLAYIVAHPRCLGKDITAEVAGKTEYVQAAIKQLVKEGKVIVEHVAGANLHIAIASTTGFISPNQSA